MQQQQQQKYAIAQGLCCETCVNVQDRSLCLHKACKNGNLNIVKWLYEQGGQKLLMLTARVSVCVWESLVQEACKFIRLSVALSVYL
jgi:hypothetical protein